MIYTGDLFRTKCDAKEDACRLLLEEQRRLGRLPDLTTPTPLPGQAAHAPGQGVAIQPPPGDGAGQAGPVKPRPRSVVPIARAPPPLIVPMPGFQRDAPLPSPAANQDPGADRQPREGGAEAPTEGQGGAGSSGTGLAAGDPGSDVPGALTERLLLAGAPSPSPSPASPPREQASSPPQERLEGDCCASDSHTPTDVVDDEGVRVASEAFNEQDDEAKAALAAEGLAAAVQVPIPEEPEGGVASGSSAGAQGWLGGPDPDNPGGAAQGYEKLPMSPDKRPPAPLTPEEQYLGAKQEQEEGV